jgi:cytoskeletal protein CcmA (bactofilin family)
MAQNEPQKSRLLSDVEIDGTIKFQGELIFDGKFKGEVIEGTALTLGESSVVEADIRTDHLTISGIVRGDVTVGEKCYLKPTAHLEGDLKTARLVMDDGATFIGSSQISPKPSNVVNLNAMRKGSAAS